ncbi:MAG: hypothetical protein COA57_08185 [Flavobacteriales bacterium]|nr:MAG: hypothetical protein COA57_08185 [Flavobacteriales bacterium]
MEFSVVVPVYNSSETLPELNNLLEESLQIITPDYEVIYVDDVSSDGSLEILKQLKSNKENIKVIRLQKNAGQWESLLTGVSKASGKMIATIDDDLQFNPEDILLLYEELKEKQLDLIYGIPSHALKGSFWQQHRIKLLNFILGKSNTSSFRVFKREVVFDNKDDFLPQKHFEAFEKNHVAYDKKSFVKVDISERKAGRSGYDFFKKTALLTNYFAEYRPKSPVILCLLGLLFLSSGLRIGMMFGLDFLLIGFYLYFKSVQLKTKRKKRLSKAEFYE